MTPPFISLARVRALGVVVAWHEGIAIAQRCSEQIVSRSARAGLDTCAIAATGSVRVSGVSSEPFTHDPLFSLATALIDSADAPAALLAVLSRSDLRDAQAHETLMRELAFFSRPDAAAAIAAVAARALARESEAASQDEFERLRAGAIAAAPPPAPVVTRHRFSRRVLVAAGGISAVALTGAAVSLMPWPSAPMWASAPVLAESSTLTAVTTTIDRLIDRGLQTLGAAATESPAVESPTPPAAVAARRRVAGTSTAVASGGGPEHAASAPSLLVDAGPLPDAIVERVETVDAEPPSSRIDTGVYSRHDQDVEPPALAYPQLPSALPEIDHENGSYLEVLVSERGTVDRVRLHSTHSTLHERMLVSAAKAWRFRPAVRDGVPVKYVARIAVPR
jgi:hypothetical protein